jgi:hypothetical protein
VGELADHAMRELIAFGKKNSELSGFLTVITAFEEMGLKPVDQMAAAQIVSDLLFFRNLVPITDDKNDWQLLPGSDTTGEGVWQNKRNRGIFSMDGGKTYYSLPEIKSVLELAGVRLVKTSISKPSFLDQEPLSGI